MIELSPEYLIEVARQIAFVGAFLGGFSATFLGLVLTENRSDNIGIWLIGALTLASCSFVITVITMTFLSISQHPGIPVDVVMETVNRHRTIGFLSFILGIYALLAGIGLSGFIKSKRFGRITAIIAALAVLVVTSVILDT